MAVGLPFLRWEYEIRLRMRITHVLIYSGTALLHDIVVPGAAQLHITSEQAPDQWVVASEGGKRESVLLDFARGVVVARAPGLISVAASGGTPLFVDEKGTIVTWNPATGERKPLL